MIARTLHYITVMALSMLATLVGCALLVPLIAPTSMAPMTIALLLIVLTIIALPCIALGGLHHHGR